MEIGSTRSFSIGSSLSVSMAEFCSAQSLASAPWGPRVAVERKSSSLLFSTWQHRRVVESNGSGRCRVLDVVTFRPRVQLLAPWLKAAQVMSFRRRHLVWRKVYGTA